MNEKLFSIGLFDCFETPSDTIKAFFCPCCFAGDIAEMLDRSYCGYCCFMCLCPDFGAIAIRNLIRTHYKIDGTILEDIAVGFCLPCCSLIQCKREADYNCSCDTMKR